MKKYFDYLREKINRNDLKKTYSTRINYQQDVGLLGISISMYIYSLIIFFLDCLPKQLIGGYGFLIISATIFLLPMIVLMIILLNKKKVLKIETMFSQESKIQKIIGGILVIFYFIISFLVMFVAIIYHNEYTIQ